MKMCGGDSGCPQFINAKEKHVHNFICDSRLKLLLWFYELQESDYPFGKNDLSLTVRRALRQVKEMMMQYYKEQNG